MLQTAYWHNDSFAKIFTSKSKYSGRRLYQYNEDDFQFQF